jgi:hypothetical protein
MSIMNLAGRTLAMGIGIAGAVVALIVTFINFLVKNIQAGGLGNAHTPTGIAMAILAGVGAVLALPFPMTSAVLMLIAGIGMLFVAGGWGAIPLVILAVGALFAYLDRKKAAA